MHFLVILARFKVGQWGTAGSRERHHLEPTIYQTLDKELLENPPD